MKRCSSSNLDWAVTWQRALSLIAEESTVNENSSSQDLKQILFSFLRFSPRFLALESLARRALLVLKV